MTKLSKTSEKSEHTYAQVNEIQSIQVDGNTTHLQLEVGTIIDEEGNLIDGKIVIAEVQTLELIQTFNTTWTNHAVAKLKTYINQLTK